MTFEFMISSIAFFSENQVEEDLRARIDEFEERLKFTNREMDIFMKKDPPVLTMDEMRSSVKVIDDINERSIKAVEDLRDINQEEVKVLTNCIYFFYEFK